MSAGLAAWIAHITFAVVLFLGWDELGLSRVVFVLLWLAGFAAQHVITSGPAPALFAPFVALLDVVLVFTVFKGDVKLR